MFKSLDKIQGKLRRHPQGHLTFESYTLFFVIALKHMSLSYQREQATSMTSLRLQALNIEGEE